MAISAKDVMELRKQTDCGMMEVMRLLFLPALFSDLHGDSSQAVSDLLWQTCSEDILSMFRSHS